MEQARKIINISTDSDEGEAESNQATSGENEDVEVPETTEPSVDFPTRQNITLLAVLGVLLIGIVSTIGGIALNETLTSSKITAGHEKAIENLEKENAKLWKALELKAKETELNSTRDALQRNIKSVETGTHARIDDVHGTLRQVNIEIEGVEKRILRLERISPTYDHLNRMFNPELRKVIPKNGTGRGRPKTLPIPD